LDIKHFLDSLLPLLSELDFVDTVDFHVEVFVLKGKISLENGSLLQVYFNEDTGTLAFALIHNRKRLWGIDYDNMRGWHVHPVADPETHDEIPPRTIREIISAFVGAWKELFE
jgi:hypothetical protein